MKAALISQGSVSSQWTAEAMRKHFSQVDMLDVKEIEVNLGKEAEVLYQGRHLGKYDCIYCKGSFRYANVLRAITTLMGEGTFIPVSAGAHTVAHDKVLTHLKLQAAGVPTPRTYLAATIDAGKKILKRMTYPVIMKVPSGTHGKGVMLADSYESASSLIDTLALLRQPFLIQEYVETEGTDIRAFIIGDKVAAVMQRTAAKGEKRANIHAGGKGKAAALGPKDQQVALNAARAVGARICAVDMLQTPRGAVVLEVNISPGIQGITAATKTDMAGLIAKYLHDQTKALKEAGAKEAVQKAVEVPRDVITKLDFRGTRILLPEYASKLSGLTERDEVVISAKPGKLHIEKTGNGE
jgi:ribosomal protein S6--L-glutamate ligase